VGTLNRGEALPDSSDVGSESRELFKVERGERLETLCPLVGQVQVDDAVVCLTTVAPHEPGGLRSVDEFYSTVVAQHEVVRDLADRGATRVGMPPYCEEELVVGWSEPCRPRLVCTPALKVSKTGAKGEKASVRIIRERHSTYDIIWSR